MAKYIIQVERAIGYENMANIYDLSYCHPRTIERLVKQHGSNIYKLDGKNHYVIVIDRFCEFTRHEAIAIASKWLAGDYYSYDFVKEKWELKNE